MRPLVAMNEERRVMLIQTPSRLAIVLVLASGLAPGQSVQPAEKLLIDCDGPELLRRVPDLAGTNFDTSQDGVDALLKSTGENLSAMLGKLADLSAAEQIHEIRLEASMGEGSQRENFRYSIKLTPEAGEEKFNELREDSGGVPAAQSPKGEFLVIGHFYKLLRYLLPQYREQSKFRYVGRATVAGQDLMVVAFAQRPESIEPRSHIGLPEGRTGLLQGLIWIDQATHRVVRLRAGLREHIKGFPFETLSTDISVVPVSFARLGTVLWLPWSVTVHAHTATADLHSVHRYSDYRLDGAGAGAEGVPPAGAAAPEDAWELLDRGILLAKENKPAEAIAPLREALQLNPRTPAVRYYLAAALRDTKDLSGAEKELREALKLFPDSGKVHNFLGILLFKRGDMAGAIAELRVSAELQPKEANVHYNLAQALEKSGDQKGALEEYRAASTLAPDNPNFKARHEQFERGTNGTTISVDVRQVLVPVVVTNKDGHYASGLTQADFHVFEDGVEQKIASFSVENAGALSDTRATPDVSQPVDGAAAAPAATPKIVPPKRRTYLICIDSLHTEFANLVSIRKSLSKLFHEEQAGDAEYVVVSLGNSVQVVRDTTRDPAAVLQAIESRDFQKLFLASRKASTEMDMREFRRALDEARQACDSGRPECDTLRRRLPSLANQIAEQDRMYTRTLLGEFRALVEQLRRAGGRRTIVLFSDGFELAPGKLAFELLVAYFPELGSMSLRTVDRMTDLEPVLHLAAASDILIYTIDSRGLYTSPFYDASNAGSVARMAPAVLRITDSNASEAADALAEMAAVTGGTFFHNNNDIFAGLQRAFADGRQYYMLSYVPNNATSDGKFRAISVRVRDPKLVVRAKRGYWAAEASN